MEDVFLAAVTTDVIMEFRDRKGFDDWYDACDDETREEMEQALTERLRRTMAIFKVKVG